MIRNNIKRIAKGRKLTIEDVSKLAGLHRYTLSRVFNNETTNISYDTLDALCRALNVKSGDLIEYVPDDQATPQDVEHVKQRLDAVQRRNTYRNKKDVPDA